MHPMKVRGAFRFCPSECGVSGRCRGTLLLAHALFAFVQALCPLQPPNVKSTAAGGKGEGKSEEGIEDDADVRGD